MAFVIEQLIVDLQIGRKIERILIKEIGNNYEKRFKHMQAGALQTLSSQQDLPMHITLDPVSFMSFLSYPMVHSPACVMDASWL